jgi:hypothetical protein
MSYDDLKIGVTVIWMDVNGSPHRGTLDGMVRKGRAEGYAHQLDATRPDHLYVSFAHGSYPSGPHSFVVAVTCTSSSIQAFSKDGGWEPVVW